MSFMIKEVSLSLTPQDSCSPERIRFLCAKKLHMNIDDISSVRWKRKSIDSRKAPVRIEAVFTVYSGRDSYKGVMRTEFREADSAKTVIIVGSGPAGLFAALTCLEHGMKPVVLERGKNVHERKKDTARLNREGVLDEESNYAFGEGGAGTFSDGKLFTRSVKRGDVSKVLSLFVQHGASDEIMYDAHPHIGSDVLPRVIENIRNTIISYGGEVHFSTKVTGLIRDEVEVSGVVCADGKVFHGPVILATGHGAHDVYDFLLSSGFSLEAKDVAVGVRLEHPQSLIDRMQYHNDEGRGRWLPAASYRFVTQAEGRGVYSFCMCPGGLIVPASTRNGELVVNGMSPSSRNGRWANSGIVVQLKREDICCTEPLEMLEYITQIEKKCFNERFMAPAQRMTDFIEGRQSSTFPETSYIPGLVSSSMDDVLPSFISSSLRAGLKDFVRFSRGKFLCEDALLIAPETRTSSPVRIVRGDDLCQIRGFYPCGEGAGYAGGIVSAALDGVACAMRIRENYYENNFR